MSSALNIRLAPEAREGGAAVTIASLPLSLTETREHPDIALIDGRGDWSAHVLTAADDGARAAVIIEPGRPGTIGSSPIPVVFDRVYAGNPAVCEIGAHVSDTDARALIEVRAIASTDASVDATLHSLLALIRASTGDQLRDARLTVSTAHGLVVQGGLADGRPVLVTTTVTDAVPESATIRIVDAHTVFEAWLPAAGAARPALVVVTGPHGATRLPTLWETSHRAALRRARDILRGEGTGDDLTAFVSDAALVQRLLHTADPTD